MRSAAKSGSARKGGMLLRAGATCACLTLALTAFGCSSQPAADQSSSSQSASESQSGTVLVDDFHNADLGNGWQVTSSMELDYAQNFTVDYFDGGYKLICLCNGERFLIAPEGAEAPEGIGEDIHLIQQPVNNIYLVASNAMCLFDALGEVDTIGVSGIKPENLSVESVRTRVEDGTIAFGGGSSAPDYELITQKGCPLAIESTMINHNPDIKQKLNDLGTTVLTEHSSYEPEALGRVEWVKLYGALFNQEDLAKSLFDEQKNTVESIASQEATGKTVAYFYINSNGSAVVRKSGDYVAQMIQLAGGDYIFDDLGGDSATATVTMEMEQFYATAKDADCIFYNATIDGGVASLDDLVVKNNLLEEFKAVQNGNVWCTDQDMYQQMIHTGTIIADMNAILRDDGSTQPTYFYKLQ